MTEIHGVSSYSFCDDSALPRFATIETLCGVCGKASFFYTDDKPWPIQCEDGERLVVLPMAGVTFSCLPCLKVWYDKTGQWRYRHAPNVGTTAQ